MWRELNQFFTPQVILDDVHAVLLSLKCSKDNLKIADLTAGEGALLEVAEKVYPMAKLFANDIDKALVRRLKREKPHWSVSNRDFNEILLKNKSFENIDIILANPPYSVPSGRHHKVSIDNLIFNVSYVASHIVKSLKLLENSGYLIAIVPEGFIHSDKDSPIVNYIRSNYKFRILKNYPNRTFNKCDAATILIIIQKEIPDQQEILHQRHPEIFHVVRGWVPIHSTSGYSEDLIPVLHTTDLWNEVKIPSKYAKTVRYLSGTYLLLPRIGRPYREKIVIYHGSQFAISDCLFAIQDNIENLIDLKQAIDHDSDFFSIYGGTGAKYISLTHLHEYLSKVVLRSKVSREMHLHVV